MELREQSLEKGTLLLYVDDLLISSEAKQDSNKSTVRVLNFLAERGYKVSPTKAQISQQWIQYLGFLLTPAAQAPIIDRKQLVHYHLQKEATPRPLRMAGFCYIWILNYGLIAKPLLEALQGGEREPLQLNKNL